MNGRFVWCLRTLLVYRYKGKFVAAISRVVFPGRGDRRGGALAQFILYSIIAWTRLGVFAWWLNQSIWARPFHIYSWTL